MFHLFSHQTSRALRRRRGTILLFVVAVLALLAVIGTAYIVMARNDKSGVRANSEAQNFTQAQEGVFNQLREVIYDNAVDCNGAILGPATQPSASPPPATQPCARFFDIPETGLLGNCLGTAGHNPSFMPDEPWLCWNLYPNGDATQLTAGRFNPNTGRIDTNLAPTQMEVDVIGPASANNPANAVYYLLPFSSPSGVRYRYAVRILDTNRMANLNTVNPNASIAADASGQYQSSYSLAYTLAGVRPLLSNANNNADSGTVVNLQDQASGRKGTSSIATGDATYYSEWQQQIFSLEKPGKIQPFDLTDELELRAYGTTGTSYLSRPAAVALPYTLAPSSGYRGNLTAWSYDRNFRPYPDPATASQYTVTPADAASTPPGWVATNNVVWPLAPRKIAANPAPNTLGTGGITVDVNTSFALAKTATNLATAMQAVGYTKTEAVAFAANYLSYCGGGKMITSNGVSMYSTYHNTDPAPNSIAQPTLSFIDSQGICIRAYNPATSAVQAAQYGLTGGTDLQASVANTIVFGYSAQPYITELSGTITTNTAGDALKFSAQAVELYNPYSYTLDLTGWKLKSNGTQDVLLGTLFPTGIPPGGYVVVFNGAGLCTASSSIVSSNRLLFDTSGTTPITLTRPYLRRDGVVDDAPVDSFSTIGFVPVPFALPASPVTLSFQRPACTAPPAAPTAPPLSVWYCTVPTTPSYAAGTALAPSLGQMNTVAASGTVVRLYDRFVDPDQLVAHPQSGSQLLNIADFNRIARLAITGTLGVVTVNGNSVTMIVSSQTIGGQLNPLPALPTQLGGSDFPVEGRVHFDFLAVPSYYSSATPFTTAPPAHNGDTRAIKLLDYIAMIDRASDSTDLGFGTTDINKIRIPGRINVNTVAYVPNTTDPNLSNSPVLHGIPTISDQVVADIIAYRSRSNSFTVNGVTYPITVHGVPSHDFTDSTAYPGYGIRSMAELYYLVNGASPDPTAPPATLCGRDQAWAKVFNNATTRSDTFVVYGIVEAITAVPGNNDNAANWYDPFPSNSATVSTNNRVNLQYRRRFIAIIDRGFSNDPRSTNTFSLPRVVAYKELPY